MPFKLKRGLLIQQSTRTKVRDGNTSGSLTIFKTKRLRKNEARVVMHKLSRELVYYQDLRLTWETSGRMRVDPKVILNSSSSFHTHIPSISEPVRLRHYVQNPAMFPFPHGCVCVSTQLCLCFPSSSFFC